MFNDLFEEAKKKKKGLFMGQRQRVQDFCDYRVSEGGGN